MNLFYLSLSYVPSRRASSVQVMKMCHALAQEGCNVTLVTKDDPRQLEAGIVDDYAFYGVEQLFAIKKLARPSFRGGGMIYNWAQYRLLRSLGENVDFVYSRDLVGAWLAVRQKMPVLFEAHGLPSGQPGSFLLNQVMRSPFLKRLVVISQALADDWREAALWPEYAGVMIAHDGASMSLVAQIENRVETNGRLHISYVGHLYEGRGVNIILDLARRLPEPFFNLIGGRDRDVARWREQSAPANLKFYGFVPPAQLPTFYSQADILLMPYQRQVMVASGNSDTSRWMSPMKMFEYMAAGKAIISSDLPVLREVLQHEHNALLVPPDDTAAWEQALHRLIADPELRQRLGRNAQQDLLNHYTWEARAKKVLHGL